MTTRLQVYKCQVCGNITEVEHASGGTLVCCGQPMALLTENTVEASKEKHLPVVTKVADGYLVAVGSVAHPMEAKHYIEWIDLVAGDAVYRQFLAPGAKPEARFAVEASGPVYAREYCNLHGLWRADG